MATQNKTLIGALDEIVQSLNRLTSHSLPAIVSSLEEIAQNTRRPTGDQTGEGL
jgi:hypothetical protein